MRETGGAPTSSPSNRRGTSPVSGHAPGGFLGVDKVALSFPLRSFEPDPTAWGKRTESDPATPSAVLTLSGTVTLGQGDDEVTAFVGVREVPEHPACQWWGKVELNPSRIFDPGGYGLASISQLRPAVEGVAAAAGALLEPEDRDVGGWSVKRLDVARDFGGVEAAPTLIRALAPIHRPWARRNLVHADPSRLGAQTLMVGSGAGVVRLYDKHAETSGVAPEGSVRWEAECRSGWLSAYGGVKRLDDVNDERAGVLARDRWEWSQMGAEVAGDLSRLVDRVRASDLTVREQAGFLGWLVMQAAGEAWVPGSRTTLAKYRRVQRQLGIAAPTDLVTTGAVVRRLDWDTGREVLRVA